jgi:D-alanine--(R)-lactate ligase
MASAGHGHSRSSRLKLAVIFGGASEEHPVSVKSARELARHLDLSSYEPFWIGITTDGGWRLCTGPGDGWERETAKPVVLSADRSLPGLRVIGPERDERIIPDLVWPLLHGRFGEDGAVQGLLEFSGIPYVGCDIQSSALCMDKSLAYMVAGDAGIAVPRFRTVSAGERVDDAGLAYPLFVKPARSGSSFGVTKVSDPEELEDAVDTARRYDRKILLEEGVNGSEVGCAILGDGAELLCGEVDQIALSHGFFRIHQEQAPEQGSDNAAVLVPADISTEARALVKESARTVYRALGCSGLSRVDMFLTGDGRVVLNEVNTMPGLTSYSRYPRMMAAAGLPFADMIDRIASVTLARERR